MASPALRLLRALRAHAPRDVALAVMLAAAVGLTQGTAALFLVPLLRLAGVAVDGAAAGRLGRVADAALCALRLRPSLAVVLIAYVLAVALQAAVGGAARVVTVRVNQRFVQALRVRLYAAVTRAAWPAIARTRGSDVSHALTTELDRVGIAVSQLLMLTNQLLVAAVYVALAALVSPVMTLVAAACGGLLLVATRAGVGAARLEGERLSEAGAALQSAAHEHVAGLKVARSYGADARNAELFAAVGDRLARGAERMAGRLAISSAWFDLGAAATLALLLVVALEVLHLTTAEVLLLVVLFGRVVPYFSGVQQGWQQFAHALPAYERVVTLAEHYAHDAEPAEAVLNVADVPAASLRSELRFENVHFAYGDRVSGADRPPVLRGVSFSVPAGQITALVGPSGVGKTTVADLALGLLQPTAGTVTIDGEPLTPAGARGWRSRVAYVAQDAFLLHDTLRANLVWARPDASDDALWEALGSADAAAFVARLPGGLDTVLGDRGATFSGGERQRIALARALLRSPALLVLDEATSALDVQSESRILAAIGALRGRTTVLVITHRASTLRDVDSVIELDEGRILNTRPDRAARLQPSDGSSVISSRPT